MAQRAHKEKGTQAWVWHFVDYEARWGPGDSMERFRAAGIELPKFLRWPLNAWQGAEGEAIRCINRLRADRDFMTEQGWLVELLNHATNVEPQWHGYLVTSRKGPMQASMVGSILRVDGRRALAFLTRLESIGLLERVAWPPPDAGGEILDDQSLRLLQDVAAAGHKTAGKRGAKGRFRGENADSPFYKSEQIERTAAQRRVEDEAPPGGRDDAGPEAKAAQAAEAAAAPQGPQVRCPQCGADGREAPKGWGSQTLQCPACKQVWRRTGPTSTSMTSTSPDGGGGPGGRTACRPGRNTSPVADSRTGPERGIVKLADVLAGQGHRYSAEANAFGEQVLAALGMVYHDRAQYVNEIAHWAKLWDRAAAELTEAGLAKVAAKVRRVAGDLRTGRTRARHAERFLLVTMKNEIRDQKRAHRTKSG
jgi:hypothetical protein